MLSPWYRSHDDGQRLTLTLHIQPGAKRTEASGVHGDALKVRLAAPPIEGRAGLMLRCCNFLLGFLTCHCVR
jgi:hypothetical protein